MYAIDTKCQDHLAMFLISMQFDLIFVEFL